MNPDSHPMFDLDKKLVEARKLGVLCVGDLMLDNFVYGEVSRISPEAPAPVIAVQREDVVIGGAGNVARNIVGLGARCIFVGAIGRDEAGRDCRKLFAQSSRLLSPRLVIDATRPTTRKLRFVSEHFSTHLLRADWEEARPVAAAVEAAIIAQVTKALGQVQAVILSDYAKGVLTPKVIRTLIERARKRGIPVIVDPKGHDYSIYRGATLITPNRKELGEAAHHPVRTQEEVAAAAAKLARLVGSEAVLVTLSEKGMLLQVKGRKPVHVPAYPAKVRDVSGAGDTVVAVLAVLLALGADFETAMRTANAAASVAVEKKGTAVVTAAELRQRILPPAVLASEEKIARDRKALAARVTEWRRQDLRIGFTNGVFDLLHPGHVAVLAQARAACDRLIVGLNSDASVRRLNKGDERPLQNEKARAEVLAALEVVDLVAIFSEDTPLQLIRSIRPQVLVKGADYRGKEVVGRDIVEAHGGQVILVNLVAGHSTTDIVRRSRAKTRR
ncbi:MAG: bifunctional protein HldE [Alphaproteobacteria bacterium]|nr:MAG: bifunctional protein HldE [Alphaproteobacteria bacterium]